MYYGRTKGTAILKNILTPRTIDMYIESNLGNIGFFSLLTDVSNHKSEKILNIKILFTLIFNPKLPDILYSLYNLNVICGSNVYTEHEHEYQMSNLRQSLL